LFHPIHRGRAVVHLAHPMGDPRVVEDPLGGRGLPGINMGHDADVPRAIEGMRPAQNEPSRKTICCSATPQARPATRTACQSAAWPNCSTRTTRLPAIVREGLVRLRHPMRIFLLLDRRARVV